MGFSQCSLSIAGAGESSTGPAAPPLPDLTCAGDPGRAGAASDAHKERFACEADPPHVEGLRALELIGFTAVLGSGAWCSSGFYCLTIGQITAG